MASVLSDWDLGVHVPDRTNLVSFFSNMDKIIWMDVAEISTE